MLQPAPVQPTYQRYLTVGQNGMLADETVWASDTRIVETAAGIGFGLAVSQGALSDRGCVIGGSTFVGVTRADQTLARADLSTPSGPSTLALDTYLQYDNAGILTMGDIWVNCYASVTPATTVTFSATTGQLGLAGTTITHARWMTTAVGSAGTPVLAVLRLGDISSR
jgi:hypothetical protein